MNRTHKLTYSHRHSSPTAGRKIWYVDTRTWAYGTPAASTEATRAVAEGFAARIPGAYVRPHYDTFIVCVDRYASPDGSDGRSNKAGQAMGRL